MNPADHVREEVRALDAYTIHPEEGLNLMNNSSLFGPNPVVQRVLRGVDPADLVDYPPIDSRPLREAAAERHGVTPDMVVAANGSNELLDFLVRTVVPPGGGVAYHPPSFSMIPTFVRSNGAVPVPVPLEEGTWALDPGAMAKAAARLAIVCRPNNPTGNAFPAEEVLQVVEGFPGIVVVDEAYEEFGPGTLLSHLDDHPTMVVLRTLSKAQGLAGVRVGYLVAHADLAREVAKVRAPFRLDTLSERVAVEALRDTTYPERAASVVRKERDRLRAGLEARGITAYPSDANFVLMKPPVDAHALTRALRERAVLVRDFGGDLAPYLRATVGPPEATDRFLDALDEALPEVGA